MAVFVLALAASLMAGSGTAMARSNGADRLATCHGERATIVGEPNGVFQGTDRADVIVTRGASGDAGGGNDLICVTGRHTGGGTAYILDNGGDDFVDGGSSEGGFQVSLGGGDDRVIGSTRDDFLDLYGGGRDRIQLGPGDDTANLRQPSRKAVDQIVLGRGNDSVSLVGSGTRSLLVGGRGRDELGFGRAESNSLVWNIDNRTEIAKAGGVVRARWRDFEAFDMSFLRAALIKFAGTSVSEELTTEENAFDVRFGSGDDKLKVTTSVSGIARGGPGHDLVQINAGFDLTANLATGSIAFTGFSGEGGFSAFGYEDLGASHYSGTAVLVGNDDANKIRGYRICDTNMDGAGGDDSLLLREALGDCNGTGPGEPSGVVAIHGGPGDDSMVGAQGTDQLFGEGGNDTADGRGGIDTCVAETESNCEN